MKRGSISGFFDLAQLAEEPLTKTIRKAVVAWEIACFWQREPELRVLSLNFRVWQARGAMRSEVRRKAPRAHPR